MKRTLQWHIGCSGFHYKEWKEGFYPAGMPQRKWFDHYCSHFHTLELNVTFYRFPRVPFLQNWYRISPAHFIFAVKAPRLITHYKKFKDARALLGDFYQTVSEGLGEKLGPVLFQLPAQIGYSGEKLSQIVDQLDPAYNNVIEFRHKSWWQQQVFDTLALHNITFCGISHPDLPNCAVVNTPVAYYRFHGVPQLYRSEYATAFLDKISRQIEKSQLSQAAYLYFNNTAALAAIHNATYLLNHLARAASLPAVASPTGMPEKGKER